MLHYPLLSSRPGLFLKRFLFRRWQLPPGRSDAVVKV
jgi:hypothetical protein